MDERNGILEYLVENCVKLRNARGPTGFGWEYPNEAIFIQKNLPTLVSDFSFNGAGYTDLAAALHVFYGIFVDYSWKFSRLHGFLPIGEGEKSELYLILAGCGGEIF